MELVDFLRARLDEDEQETRAAAEASADQGVAAGQRWGRSHGRGIYGETGMCVVVGPDGFLEPAIGDHIARHDPARVLAEVEAKRVALREYERLIDSGEYTGMLAVEDILRAHARAWRDHPDFDPEWLKG